MTWKSQTQHLRSMLGMELSFLKDLTWYFQEAEPQAKKKLLGSIFPAKLIFKDENYRTSVMNLALSLIRKTEVYKMKKRET